MLMWAIPHFATRYYVLMVDPQKPSKKFWLGIRIDNPSKVPAGIHLLRVHYFKWLGLNIPLSVAHSPPNKG